MQFLMTKSHLSLKTQRTNDLNIHYTGHSESITTFVLAQIISIEKIATIIDISEQPKKNSEQEIGIFHDFVVGQF